MLVLEMYFRCNFRLVDSISKVGIYYSCFLKRFGITGRGETGGNDAVIMGKGSDLERISEIRRR